jgi:gliding motility-associated-like protein
LVELVGNPDRPVTIANWTPFDSVNCGPQPCLDFQFWPKISQFVTLEVLDSNGCPATDRIWVQITPNIFVPNVIKINSDDNYSFFFQAGEPIPVLKMQIFDRWGNLVFENKNFQTNDISAGWNGTFKNKNVLPGVYVWWAEIERVPGKKKIPKHVAMFRNFLFINN